MYRIRREGGYLGRLENEVHEFSSLILLYKYIFRYNLSIVICFSLLNSSVLYKTVDCFNSWAWLKCSRLIDSHWFIITLSVS